MLITGTIVSDAEQAIFKTAAILKRFRRRSDTDTETETVTDTGTDTIEDTGDDTSVVTDIIEDSDFSTHAENE